MAEVKNAFIKSKMNKDLEARLIPQGEYRDAQNIQVSKSEGDDVGALENVLGNRSVADFNGANNGVSVGSCIGFFVDEFNSTAYLFFTDYTDLYTDNVSTYNKDAKNFIFSYNTRSNTIIKLVEGSFLNFSTNRPIIGVNLLEDLLFFTDNRNQPRKINVKLAISEGISYYNTEDKISVAKYNPYQAISVIKETSPGSGVYETTMKDRFSEYIPLNNSDSPNVANPYWAGETSGNPNFAGDPKYLEDKFVRFSYRFKFIDGEYSIFAPFTQECFIPKQDGYFLSGDEKQTIASTVVEFMENKVNQIDLQIPMPKKVDGTTATVSEINSNFQITEIDILYKESNSLAVQVLETISVVGNPLFAGTGTVFEYSYLSTKPYRTLPEAELIRVYDKTPVKALGQEVISNRIVYSNFQDKHTPPPAINYQVSATPKYGNSETFTSLSQIEYPNHSVKQNRNYQVGIVLSDRYGRQSTVLLSNNTDDSSETFRADTVYLSYKTSNNSISFPGDSLKVQFNTLLTGNGFDKNELNGIPGLYNGDPTSDGYNPTGWYSYKIVVKQLEQEYYNVYTPGAMKGMPYFTGAPTAINPAEQNASFITLLNDNINKVPRDLSEVGPQDKTFRSSVRLFGRVENTQSSFSNIGNQQYFPGRKSFTTSTIEDLFDLFDVSEYDPGNSSPPPITSDDNPYYAFFRSESNPFIAEFITSQTTADQFGVVNKREDDNNPFLKFENLAVLETAPTISRLDIYYETSTAGLVLELNNAIDAGSGGAGGVGNFVPSLTESASPGDVVVSNFFFTDLAGNPISPNPTNVTLVRQYNNTTNTDVTKFNLIDNGDGTYDITVQAGEYFYYGTNGITYALEFNVDGGSPNFTRTISLGNVAPSITNTPTTINASRGQLDILTPITGVNGSNPSGGQSNIGLTYNITAQSGSGNFLISNGEVINNDSTAEGTGTFTLQATDAGGATSSTTFTVTFTQPTVPSYFTDGSMEVVMKDGEGAALYFASNANDISTNATTVVNSGTNNNYTQGFSSLSSLNSTVTNDICTSGSAYEGVYVNKSSIGSLTQGTFYFITKLNNLYPMAAGTPGGVSSFTSEINQRWAIQYRANSNSSWQAANDVAGNSIQYNGGTFENSSASDIGMVSTTNTSTSFGTNGIGINQTAIATGAGDTWTVYPAGRVFAFNIAGDYRFLFGNLAGGGGIVHPFPYDNPPQLVPSPFPLNGSVNCNVPFYYQGGAMIQQVFFGDFNAPNSGAGGIPAVAPEFSTYGSVYKYRISSTGSATALTNPDIVASIQTPSGFTDVYAAEPFAKYVTQFYTDINLTTKFTATNNYYYYYCRLQYIDPNSLPFPIQFASNYEYNKNGVYQSRLNSTGLNIDSTPIISLTT